MKYKNLRCLCAIFVLLTQLTIAQTDNQGQNFSVNPNSIGELQNSVNLYTGQVGFPMTVASLPGRGGLQPKIVIQYSSAGIKNQVSTWNREAPTGLLGLGWSLNFPKIICNHKETATRHDDEFYLVEGGTSLQLICTDSDKYGVLGYRTYQSKNYHPWKIKYYYPSEKWVIEKDDATRYIYGDAGRNRTDGTIQYMIRWGNWIGDSRGTLSQQEHAYIWNLSEVINLWDDKVTYSYDNIEEEVGSHVDPENISNPRHTKSSVLKRITGPTGNYVELAYGMKTYVSCDTDGDFRCENEIREYQDPHVEATEPDAYQEKYEARYLQSIAAFDEYTSPLYDVAFEYDWIGSGEFVKRTLTGIQQTNYTGTQLPKTEFEYFDEGVEKGYLQLVDNSIGGRITFQYARTSIIGGRICLPIGTRTICNDIEVSSLGDRDLEINAPDNSYSEPEIFMGPDYVVVVWRKNGLVNSPFGTLPVEDPRFTQLHLYEWNGEWIKHDLGTIGNLRYSNEADKHEMVVALEREHFGIALRQGTDTYRVNLFHKNSKTGGWNSFNENVTLHDGRLPDAQYLSELFFKAGLRYIAFGNLTSSQLYLYTWNGNEWVKKTVTHSSPAAYAYGGASNYVIAENTANGPIVDGFWVHYLSEDGIWIIKQFNADFDTDTMESDRYRKDRSYWYCSPSFAFVMADDNPEYMFELGEDYERVKRTELLGTADYYPVYWRSNSLINISNREEDEFKVLTRTDIFRYNGNFWDANRSSFLHMIKGAPDAFGKSYGNSRLELSYYNANTGEWETNEYTTSEARFDRYIQFSSQSVLMGTNIYYREPDGQWLDIGDIAVDRHNSHSWRLDLRTGANTIYSSIPYQKTELNRIDNGSITKDALSDNMDKRDKWYRLGKNLTGNDMFVGFSSDKQYKFDATSFKLYRWSDEGYRNGHKAVVVAAVHVDDGNLKITKSYSYTYNSARMNASGDFPLFNRVTVANNNSENPGQRPRGYARHYFHNGRSLSELSNIPSEQIEEDVLLYAGNSYRTEMYDDQDNLVSSSEIVYSTFFKEIYNSENTAINQSYYVRPTKSYANEYLSGAERSMYTTTTYNEYGLPSEIHKFSNANTLLSKAKTSERFIYYPSKYSTAQHNIISEIIGAQKIVNSDTITSTATVWEEIDSIPRAVKTYNWKGFNNPVFDAWDGSIPASQWRLENNITLRDAKGNILASHDFLNEPESAIYDDLLRNPIASAEYATYDQIAATSFEDRQMGRFTSSSISNRDAYTGTQSLDNGAATLNNPPSGKYSLYYWYKDNAGTVTVSGGTIQDHGDQQVAQGWTLKKWSVDITGAGSITLNTTGYIDEVRIHPQEAYMNTFVYNDKQQKIAETGSDMATTFFFYDDLNRQHYVTDQEGSIVLHYEYGFKKLNE